MSLRLLTWLLATGVGMMFASYALRAAIVALRWLWSGGREEWGDSFPLYDALYRLTVVGEAVRLLIFILWFLVGVFQVVYQERTLFQAIVGNVFGMRFVVNTIDVYILSTLICLAANSAYSVSVKARIIRNHEQRFGQRGVY